MTTTDADRLRSAQGPLKDRYRNEPAAALVTLEAEGGLDEGITCSVQTSTALVQAGLHPGTGESDASDEELATLERLTERYCVVFQTLAQTPVLSVSHGRI